VPTGFTDAELAARAAAEAAPPPCDEKTEPAPDGENAERRRNRHWFDRLTMLSDGVFAIAATLLSLDVRGPATWRNLSELWAGLVPELNAYVLGFLVIAVFWLAHRRFMATVTRVDPPLTVLTLVMLGLVGLVPGATHISIGQTYETGMTLYAALIVLIGFSMAAIWGYASLVANLVTPEIPKSARWFQLFLMMFTSPLFLFLTNEAPLSRNEAGWVPVILAALFVIGWRMRLWVLRRLTVS
jgi:uncharacterized membrane protein